MPLLELTDRFCQTAKPDPGQRQSDFYDARPNKGLILRVSATDKSWSFIFQVPGGTKGERGRLSLGAYPAISLAKARTLVREAKGHLADGRDPRTVMQAQKAAAMTVAGLVKSYINLYAKPELRSWEEIQRRLEKNALPVIGGTRLADLHKRDVNGCIDPILERRA